MSAPAFCALRIWVSFIVVFPNQVLSPNRGKNHTELCLRARAEDEMKMYEGVWALL